MLLLISSADVPNSDRFKTTKIIHLSKISKINHRSKINRQRSTIKNKHNNEFEYFTMSVTLPELPLEPYWNPAGRVLCLLTVLFPALTVLALNKYTIMKKASMATNIRVYKSLRIALAIHAAYFSTCVLLFEVFIDQSPATLIGTVPAEPEHLFWMMTNLSGELFFVATVAFGFMAMQEEIPRWTLLIPIAQTTYNLKNTLIWCFFSKTFSPDGKAIDFMIGDGQLILALAFAYIYNFVTTIKD